MTTPIIKMTEEQKEAVKNDLLKFELPKKLTGLEGSEEYIKQFFANGGDIKDLVEILKRNGAVKATPLKVKQALRELNISWIDDKSTKKEPKPSKYMQAMKLHEEKIARGEESTPPLKPGPKPKAETETTTETIS